MKLIKPSFKIVRMTSDPLKLIEEAGRLCYQSEPNETTQEAFIRARIRQGHESILEHASMSVMFITDRGVTHEEVRHRLCAYSQESTRWCDYEGKEMEFVIPPWCDIHEGVYHMDSNVKFNCNNDEEWFNLMLDSELSYIELRTNGWKPEQARSVLPISLKTSILHTANLREWRHILNLRAAGKAGRPHPQMREIMIPLLLEVKKLIPVIFEDIEPYKGE